MLKAVPCGQMNLPGEVKVKKAKKTLETFELDFGFTMKTVLDRSIDPI